MKWDRVPLYLRLPHITEGAISLTQNDTGTLPHQNILTDIRNLPFNLQHVEFERIPLGQKNAVEFKERVITNHRTPQDYAFQRSRSVLEIQAEKLEMWPSGELRKKEYSTKSASKF